MPTIITASQLRSVLGVSSALYDDTYLNQIINTAETVVLPMLAQYKSFVQKTSLTDNVATFGYFVDGTLTSFLITKKLIEIPSWYVLMISSKNSKKFNFKE